MAHHRQRRILVVDDDPQLREMYTLMLQDRGYTVATAADGRDALALIKQVCPAVVISDMNMPGMDGRALLCTLKRDYRGIKTVLISGEPYDTDEMRILGAMGFMRKPIRLAELVRSVDTMVQTEQRSAARLRMGLPVTVPDGRQIRTVDISGDGMMLAGDTGLEPGATAPFTVHSPFNAQLITMHAAVVRLGRLQDRPVTAVRFAENIGEQLLGCLRG